MDPIALLRMLNLFNPKPDDVVSDLPGGGFKSPDPEILKFKEMSQRNLPQESQTQPETKRPDWMSMLDQNQQGPMTRELMAHLSDFPQDKPFPGWKKAINLIAPMLIGVQPFEEHDKQARQDWLLKAQGLEHGAATEGMQQRLGINIADLARKHSEFDTKESEYSRHHGELEDIARANTGIKQAAELENASHHKAQQQHYQNVDANAANRTESYSKLVDARTAYMEAEAKRKAAAAGDKSALNQLRQESVDNLKAANNDPSLSQYMIFEGGHYRRDWKKLAKLNPDERILFESNFRKALAGKDINLDEPGGSKYEPLNNDDDEDDQ